MIDIISILIAFVSGVVITLFTLPYTINENIRRNVNQCVSNVGEEIRWNRNTVVVYKKHIQKIRNHWKVNREIDNFREWFFSIGVGNSGLFYTALKFDAFNYYKNSNVPSEVGIAFDYILTEFYGKCKEYCFNLDRIQNKIVEYNAICEYELVEKEWEKIDKEFEAFSKAFIKFSNTPSGDLKHIKYCGIKKMSWFEWHILKIKETGIIFKDDPKSWNESREFGEYEQ